MRQVFRFPLTLRACVGFLLAVVPIGDACHAGRRGHAQLLQSGGAATFSTVVAVAGTGPSELAIFPNPAHDSFIITGPAAARYRVLNQLGQEINHGTLINSAATVGLAHLPAGLYQITLETSEGRAVRSLVHR